MAKPKRIGHLVLNVKDLAASTKFYTDILGFQVSRQRETGTFLTCGKIHHDLALFQAPVGALPVTGGQLGLNHFAVQVEDMADLQQAFDEFKDLDVKLDHNTDHGMTSSIYFFDPDGNRI
jgi:catechol 2,3-dioxygenase